MCIVEEELSIEQIHVSRRYTYEIFEPIVNVAFVGILILLVIDTHDNNVIKFQM